MPTEERGRWRLPMKYIITDPEIEETLSKGIEAKSFEEAATKGIWIASGTYEEENLNIELLIEDENNNKKTFLCTMETNPTVFVEEII